MDGQVPRTVEVACATTNRRGTLDEGRLQAVRPPISCRQDRPQLRSAPAAGKIATDRYGEDWGLGAGG